MTQKQNQRNRICDFLNSIIQNEIITIIEEQKQLWNLQKTGATQKTMIQIPFHI